MRPLYVNYLKCIARSTIGKFASSIVGRKTRFVIFSSGRSGSNVLVSLLKQHPRIRVHSEIFGEYQLEDPGIRRRINRIGPAKYMEEFLKPLTFETALGVKVLYYQLDERYGRVRGIPGVEDVRRVLLSDDDLLFIHLKRRDLFALLASMKLAETSRNWVGESYAVNSIEIDTEWAEQMLKRIESDAALHDDFLPRERCLNLFYEELISNTESEMEKTFKFLGVDHVPMSIPLKRQTEKPHKAYVSNYEQLKAHFAGRDFEKFM